MNSATLSISTGETAAPGRTVSVTIDHAALVAARRSRTDGRDLSVRYVGPGGRELRVWVENPNTSTTKVWFCLMAEIDATTSTDYVLHWGDLGRPARNPQLSQVGLTGRDRIQPFYAFVASATLASGGNVEASLPVTGSWARQRIRGEVKVVGSEFAGFGLRRSGGDGYAAGVTGGTGVLLAKIDATVLDSDSTSPTAVGRWVEIEFESNVSGQTALVDGTGLSTANTDYTGGAASIFVVGGTSGDVEFRNVRLMVDDDSEEPAVSVTIPAIGIPRTPNTIEEVTGHAVLHSGGQTRRVHQIDDRAYRLTYTAPAPDIWWALRALVRSAPAAVPWTPPGGDAGLFTVIGSSFNHLATASITLRKEVI